jgi:hypothetical protein
VRRAARRLIVRGARRVYLAWEATPPLRHALCAGEIELNLTDDETCAQHKQQFCAVAVEARPASLRQDLPGIRKRRFRNSGKAI